MISGIPALLVQKLTCLIFIVFFNRVESSIHGVHLLPMPFPLRSFRMIQAYHITKLRVSLLLFDTLCKSCSGDKNCPVPHHNLCNSHTRGACERTATASAEYVWKRLSYETDETQRDCDHVAQISSQNVISTAPYLAFLLCVHRCHTHPPTFCTVNLVYTLFRGFCDDFVI